MENTQTATPSHPSANESAGEPGTAAPFDQGMQPAAHGQPPSSSPSGRTKRPEWTRDGQSAAKPNIDKWWTPVATRDNPTADEPIDGVMAWQGDIIDKDRGRPRRIFILREKGHFWGVSERSGITELRRVANGTRVWLACKGKRSTGKMINNEPQTVLDFELIVGRLEDKPVVVMAPIPQDNAGGVPPGSDDDIPF